MPPSDPKPKSYRQYHDQARREFEAQMSPMPPVAARAPRQSTSNYAHERASSAKRHEAAAAGFAKRGDVVGQTQALRQAVASTTKELATKRADQKSHTPGTLAYKQHEHYITQRQGDLGRLQTAATGAKDAWVKSRADGLKKAGS
ncbi:hypothetical protein [Chitinolyticbacter meiyuanensis]|uniref:hypothetical protein n=1 Tax=Chitinolyticbacter meiyuanensis TaxID=682798 RepID=UPI0011E596B4|nr:hypothetical protein [Chitinolyticbacter meiyuanensis]